jgi:hypothetical protein
MQAGRQAGTAELLCFSCSCRRHAVRTYAAPRGTPHSAVAVAVGHARPRSHFIVPACDSAPATARAAQRGGGVQRGAARAVSLRTAHTPRDHGGRRRCTTALHCTAPALHCGKPPDDAADSPADQQHAAAHHARADGAARPQRGGGIHSATGCSLRVFFVGHARRHDLHGRFRDGCEVPLDRTTVDVRFFSQIQPYASQLATMEAGV